MKKIILAGVGAVIVAGACVGGMQLSGQAVDKAMKKLSNKVNSLPNTALKIEELDSSFSSRSHKIHLIIDSEPFVFEQSVSILPWGASAEVELVQEGYIFEELRRETTFSSLPMELSWCASGFSDSVSTRLKLEEFTIKELNSSSPDIVTIYPADLNVDIAYNGEHFSINGSFDGFSFSDSDDEEAKLGKVSADLAFQKVSGVFFSKRSELLIESYKYEDRRSSGKVGDLFEVKQLSWKDASGIDDDSLSFEEKLNIDHLTFLDWGDGISLDQLEVKMDLEGISQEAASFLLSNAMDLEYMDPSEYLSKVLAMDLAFELDGKVDKFAIVNDEKRQEGSASIAGKAQSPAMDVNKLMQGDMEVLKQASADFNIELSQSFIAELADDFGFPYTNYIDEGYITQRNELLSTNLSYKDGEFMANGKAIN